MRRFRSEESIWTVGISLLSPVSNASGAIRCGVRIHSARAASQQRHGRFALLPRLIYDRVEQRPRLYSDRELLIDPGRAAHAHRPGAGRVIGIRAN
jgi:hypothetical protein